jgi:uncharacterized protein (DUF1778 family)
MAERYPARVNLRLSQETFDAYKEAAEAVGQDVTGLMRQIVDANAGGMAAIAQSAQAVSAGRPKEGAAVFVALMQAAMGQGQLALAQAHALQAEMEELEKKQAAG